MRDACADYRCCYAAVCGISDICGGGESTWYGISREEHKRRHQENNDEGDRPLEEGGWAEDACHGPLGHLEIYAEFRAVLGMYSLRETRRRHALSRAKH